MRIKTDNVKPKTIAYKDLENGSCFLESEGDLQILRMKVTDGYVYLRTGNYYPQHTGSGTGNIHNDTQVIPINAEVVILP